MDNEDYPAYAYAVSRAAAAENRAAELEAQLAKLRVVVQLAAANNTEPDQLAELAHQALQKKQS